MGLGMEEPAMCRRHHRPPVPWAREAHEVEEEIDGVDMHDIGVAHMAEHGRRERIAHRAAIGEPHHLRAHPVFARDQPRVRIGEDAVERQHAHFVAGANLRLDELGDDFLDPAEPWRKLPRDMNDPHIRRCSPIRKSKPAICRQPRKKV